MKRVGEHPFETAERLGVQARLAIATLTQYYHEQLSAEHFQAAPKELATALGEIRRALSCSALVAELSDANQRKVLEVLSDRSSASSPDGGVSLRSDHIDALLQELTIELICTHARETTSFALLALDRASLPDCERFQHGDLVMVRGQGWSCPYEDSAGTFLRYTDPRIRHPERWAIVEVDGQEERFVRPAHLEFAPEEEQLELGSYRPLREYQIESETWPEMQDDGRHRCALVLKYRLTERSPWHQVALSAGRGDDLDVFTDGIAAYVLSVNELLPYAGVQVFVDDDEVEHFFFQEWQVEEVLGADFCELTPAGKLKRIAEGCQPRGGIDDYEHDHVGTWRRSGFTLRLYDTGQIDHLGKSILAYQLQDQEYGPAPIFEGADFSCSPLQDVASDGAAADVLGFLGLLPGDTDSDRFDSYTPRQLKWCEERAHELTLVAEQFEQRHECRALHEAGQTDQAVLGIARSNPVEDLFEVLDMDIFETYDLVTEVCRRRSDPILHSLLGELHYLRNVEIVGGEDELARFYE